MYITELQLKNFRNYSNQTIALSNGVNVFLGHNGMGKTNLLEAVVLASIGRSPRTPRDKELIKWGKEQSKVSITCEKEIGTESVDITLSKVTNKAVIVNGMPVSRLGELMGAVATVFFSPSELKIVQGGPSERRSFIDIALCQLSKTYFYLLTRYQKILAQRNKLLKSGKATEESLEIWDTQLASEGAKVIKTRRGFIQNLAPIARAEHAFLTDNKEELEVSYEGLDGEGAKDIEKAFLIQLKKDRQRDIKFMHTHIGPQREDLCLKISDMDLRAFGSQGQQRTTALSLKLAELELAKQKSNEAPSLLLDDVLSELDKTRQQKLLTRTQNFQTLITCTHLEPDVANALGSNITIFKVENGSVVGDR